MPWVYVSGHGRRRDQGNPQLAGLWSHVANLRLREGDREGAARARVAARFSGSIRKTPAWPVIRERRYTGTVHYLTDKRTADFKPALVHVACNYASPNSSSTADLTKVNCENCRRTHVFQEAEDERTAI